MTCIFCQIANGEIPATLLHQDDEIIAFNDIDPKAPHHILIIPREHISTINDLKTEQSHLISKMVMSAQKIAKSIGVSEGGYRLVMNCNQDGGQAVYHIHLHLLGGRVLHWPPG
ncbi:MAG: histidine triad nucleotide-binding protein [Gammaproteobacteria bacterium]